jgi:proline iminopeptidase
LLLGTGSGAVLATAASAAAKEDSPLYPEIAARVSGWLPVSDGHELYYEEAGYPDGLPIVYVHGGPGGTSAPWVRRLFDPKIYRIVLYDQRGGGRSRYRELLVGNTTENLVADLDCLRRHLGIDRWSLCAGSWGTAVALSYAEQNPQFVSGLVLRGVFLGRREDVDWMYRFGASQFFPELWRELTAGVPPDRLDRLPQVYFERLSAPDPTVRHDAAERALRWSSTVGSDFPAAASRATMLVTESVIAANRLKFHYFRNDCFLPPQHLLRGAHKLASIPGTIIQGRCDLVCPPASAIALSGEWPSAALQIIAGAGHTAERPAMQRALVAATRRLAAELA